MTQNPSIGINMLIRNAILTLACLIFTSKSTAFAQNKNISLEDIWLKPALIPAKAPQMKWMKDSKFYTESANMEKAFYILKRKTQTGQLTDTIYKNPHFSADEYEFSQDETKLIFQTQTSKIYRYSTKSNVFVADLVKKTLVSLLKDSLAQVAYPSFSPQSTKVAFCKDNNLFIKNLINNRLDTITKDGSLNKIINGSSDWVYEEELDILKAYEWSPCGQYLAYLKFDETLVQTYHLQMWDNIYPNLKPYKYPKTGTANAKVSLYIYDLENHAETLIAQSFPEEIYFTHIEWFGKTSNLSFQTLNRQQNEWSIFHVNVENHKVSKPNLILKEVVETYHAFAQKVHYLKDKPCFVYKSEKGDYNHFYLFNYLSFTQNAWSEGYFQADELINFNEKNKLFYYTSFEKSPLEKHLYQCDENGKNKKMITQEAGLHKISMSEDANFFIDSYSNTETPHQYLLKSGKNLKTIRVLENNYLLKQAVQKYNFAKKEFFNFKTPQNTELNAWIMKPAKLNANQKYPVLVYVYGGPNSQTVLNRWEGKDFQWFQHLVSLGYIVVSVDGRGTGGKSNSFTKSTYKKLGVLETEDLEFLCEYLKKIECIDANRIGIWGWSYGGYLASMAITKAAEYFKMAIAVAPVSDWRYYDTIYSERYMQTPLENEAGFDSSSVLKYVNKFKGKFLLIHGSADDNVHLPHSIELQKEFIKNNKELDMFVFPDKNHGIYGGNARYYLYKKMTDYILKNL